MQLKEVAGIAVDLAPPRTPGGGSPQFGCSDIFGTCTNEFQVVGIVSTGRIIPVNYCKRRSDCCQLCVRCQRRIHQQDDIKRTTWHIPLRNRVFRHSLQRGLHHLCSRLAYSYSYTRSKTPIQLCSMLPRATTPCLSRTPVTKLKIPVSPL